MGKLSFRLSYTAATGIHQMIQACMIYLFKLMADVLHLEEICGSFCFRNAVSLK